jgi:hypothetical protein
MKNWRINALAIVLLILFNIWAWSRYSSATSQLETASNELKELSSIAEELAAVRQKNIRDLPIVRQNHDYVRDLTFAFRNSQIVGRGTSLTASQAKTSQESGIALKMIRNPIKTPVTIRQVAEFINEARLSTAGYNINSLRLTPANKNRAGEELWNTEFSLYYCEEASTANPPRQ